MGAQFAVAGGHGLVVGLARVAAQVATQVANLCLPYTECDVAVPDGESPSWLRHRILIPACEGSNPSSPAIHRLRLVYVVVVFPSPIF